MKTIYHITPKKNLKKIFEDKYLMPLIGKRSKKLNEEKPAIYTFSTFKDMEEGLYNWVSEEFSENIELSILEIEIPDNFYLNNEVEWETKIYDKISLNYIKKIMDEEYNEIKKYQNLLKKFYNPLLDKEISFRDEFYFLSNLYPCTISYNNIIFKSSEHLYQYLKVEDTKEGDWWKEKIINSEDGKIAKKLASNEKMPSKLNNIEKYNFNSLKDFKLISMKIALKEKFYNSKESKKLQELLINTKDFELIERNTWKDVFWGVYSKTNKGQNQLGKLLMEIREELLNLQLNNNIEQNLEI